MSIEPLEARIAPAALFTYTDLDGDLVTIKTSKGTNQQLDAIITVKTVGSTKIVQEIDFSVFGNAGLNGIFEGTDLIINAVKKTAQGDGVVHIGYIDGSASNGSAGNDGSAYHLGRVVIDGDVGQIDAGLGDGKAGIASLTVGSLGRFNNIYQPTTNKQSLSNILGGVGALTVRGDIYGVTFTAGSIGTLTVGGSITNSIVSATGALGTAKVGGELSAGAIDGGTLGNVTVAGSVFAGRIKSIGSMKNISIGGNLEGVQVNDTGIITSGGSIGNLTIKGSLLGPAFNTNGFIQRTGFVTAVGDLGAVKIFGDLRGASTQTFMGNDGITQGGGGISVGGKIASISIGGSFLGGSDDSAGGSDLNTGVIYAGRQIGPIRIGGSIVGTFSEPARIYAGGPDAPTGTRFLAIASLTVKGRVEWADIAGGLIGDGLALMASKDAQIGSVSVGGDWIASNLLAGTTAMGEDRQGVFSKIGSVKIGGTIDGAIDNPAAFQFRFAAQEIASFTVGGAKQVLKTGRGNDLTEIFLGSLGKVGLVELPAA